MTTLYLGKSTRDLAPSLLDERSTGEDSGHHNALTSFMDEAESGNRTESPERLLGRGLIHRRIGFFLTPCRKCVYPMSRRPDDMTKADLVEKVTRLGDLTRRDGEVIVETVFDSVISALQSGDKIEIRGFGSFRIRQRNPRIGRNPKTGRSE